MNPRCPNGTRRNKKTGQCEASTKSKAKSKVSPQAKTNSQPKTKKKVSFIYGKLYYSKAMSKQHGESVYEFVGHNIQGMETIRTYLREL